MRRLSDVHPVGVPHMTRPSPLGLFPVLRLLVFLAAAGVVAAGAWYSRPPHDLTIEVGAVGSSFYNNAVRYKEILATDGIDLHIISKDSTLDIVKDVADPASPAEAGFVAQDVSSIKDAGVSMISVVQLQPLFVFASADLGRRSVLDDLRGRKIVTLPRNSATANATLRVFQLMGITLENTSFTFLPLADAVQQLRAGKFDAGAFMLSADNQIIREMAADSGLNLMPFSEVHAIANALPFLRPVILPRGTFNIADAIPPNDTPMVATSVELVAEKSLHPWLVYSLLEAITQTHRGPTAINDAGEFPTIAGSQLAVNPFAAQWYKNGLPWVWRELPPGLASFVDRYEPRILAVIAIGGLLVICVFVAEFLGLLIGTLAWIGRRGGRT